MPVHRLPSARVEEYQPNTSTVFVVNWEKFKAMSSSAIQQIFRRRHILLLNAPIETFAFDREGLEHLGSLTTVRPMEGNESDIVVLSRS